MTYAKATRTARQQRRLRAFVFAYMAMGPIPLVIVVMLDAGWVFILGAFAYGLLWLAFMYWFGRQGCTDVRIDGDRMVARLLLGPPIAVAVRDIRSIDFFRGEGPRPGNAAGAHTVRVVVPRRRHIRLTADMAGYDEVIAALVQALPESDEEPPSRGDGSLPGPALDAGVTGKASRPPTSAQNGDHHEPPEPPIGERDPRGARAVASRPRREVLKLRWAAAVGLVAGMIAPASVVLGHPHPADLIGASVLAALVLGVVTGFNRLLHSEVVVTDTRITARYVIGRRRAVSTGDVRSLATFVTDGRNPGQQVEWLTVDVGRRHHIRLRDDMDGYAEAARMLRNKLRHVPRRRQRTSVERLLLGARLPLEDSLP